MRRLSRTSELVVILLGLGFVASVGTIVADYGETLLIAMGAVVVVSLFLARPEWGLWAVAALLPIQNVFVVSSGVTLAKAVGAAVFMAWGGRKLLTGESFRAVFSSAYFWAGGLFVGLAFASEVWARVPGRAVGAAQQLLLLFGLGVIVVDVVRNWTIADRVAKALITGALVAASLTIVQFLSGVERAGEDISGGVNATPSLLVTLLPLGFYLLRLEESPRWRALGFSYLVLGPAAILFTFSRFNLLLMPLVILALSADAFMRRGGRGWILALASAGTIVGAVAVPWESVAERANSILPYLRSEAGPTGVAGLATERGYHLRVGLAIASDHPILGAGYDNYGVLFRDEYQFRVPGRLSTYGGIRNPHSSHMGILSNLGIVGVIIWGLLLLGVGLGSALKAARLKTLERESTQSFLAKSVALAVALQVFAYGWYASTDRDPLLWLMLSLSVALLGAARRELTASRLVTPRRPGGEVASIAGSKTRRSSGDRDHRVANLLPRDA